ncbi:alpha/beta hydrolase [Williamsia sp. 1138]|uniref:alpha/beta fold hydrolase n=1 Tax=Williamsia sp. 1138 TaxID=1903117 RepID=UPI000A0F59FA|nr:alpha/beta hydrolase [Williamsia sp. 1138]OZG27054.1 alpha/beta hydrolase [Williamsia sp. 1138]
MERSGRLEILAGSAGVATLGALAVGAAVRSITRRTPTSVDPNSIEDFGLIYDDHASIVVADDGVPLAVREVGPSDAPLTVVFVHGFCLRMSTWHFQRRDLAVKWGDDVRMVFFDHRGHGESGQASPNSCTITQMAADLEAVLRSVVPVGPVVLVGHSMGGMAIMALASRRPELFGSRVIGVGLVASAAHGIAEAGLGRGLQNPLVDAFRLSVRQAPRAVEAGRGLTRLLMAPVLTAGSFGSTFHSPAVAEFTESVIQRTRIDTVVNFLRALEEHDETAGLAVLSGIDTMVACGYEDKVTPLPNSVELHNKLGPKCELVGVADCGHMVMLENPAVITESIDALVQRVPRQ